MEDSGKDLVYWKERVRATPDGLGELVKEMPREVIFTLVKDPDVGRRIADAISESVSRDESETNQRRKSYAEEEAERRRAESHRRLVEEAAEKAREIQRQQELKKQQEQEAEEARKLNLYMQIQRMDVGEKTKLARSGDKDARSILVKDGNEQVAMAVLENPMITQQEIEMISQSRSAPEDLLREIAKNKDWCKAYNVIYALVNNPKTPVGISMGFVKRLRPRDLKLLAQNKGVPEALRVITRKFNRDRLG